MAGMRGKCSRWEGHRQSLHPKPGAGVDSAKKDARRDAHSCSKRTWDSAYHSTQRLLVNLIWSPIPSIDIGLEYLYGRRRNKDGKEGSADQLQVATYFRF